MGMFGMSQAYMNRYRSSGPMMMRSPMNFGVARMPMARSAGPIFVMGGMPQQCHCGDKAAAWAGLGGMVFGGILGLITGRKTNGAAQMMQQQMPSNLTSQQALSNLNTLYGSKYKIVDNGDGTFTATDGTKQLRGTYDEIQQQIGGTSTATPIQSTDTPTAGGDKVQNGGDGSKVGDKTGDKDKVDGDNTGGGSKVDDKTGDKDKVDGDNTGDGKVDDKTGDKDKVDGDNTGGGSKVGDNTGDKDKVDGDNTGDGKVGDNTGDKDKVDGDNTGGGSKVDDKTGDKDKVDGDNTGDGKVGDKGSATHTVKQGENLWNIAKQHLKDGGNANPTNKEILEETNRLMEINGLKYDSDNYHVTIKPGDVIKYGDDTADKTSSPAKSKAAKTGAKSGDKKTDAELIAAAKKANDGLRNTWTKGVLYNEDTGKHYYQDKNGNYHANDNVKQTNSDGSYYDKSGQLHTMRKTYQQNIFYDEKTKTHYERKSDGTFVERKDIKQANKDGSYYDQNGVLRNKPQTTTQSASTQQTSSTKTHFGARQPWL